MPESPPHVSAFSLGGGSLPNFNGFPHVSFAPGQEFDSGTKSVVSCQHGASQASQKGRRGRACKGGSGRMDSYAHIIGTSMGRDAV